MLGQWCRVPARVQPGLWGLTQNLSNQEQQLGFWAGSPQAAQGEEEQKDSGASQLSLAEVSQHVRVGVWVEL